MSFEMCLFRNAGVPQKYDQTGLLFERCGSTVVFGDEQSAFALPRLITSTKDDRENALKNTFTSFLRHTYKNKLHQSSLTQER